MARFAFIALLAPALISSFVGAAPLRLRRSNLSRRAFTESAYADFQISGGVAGNAEAEANAVFVDPFNGVDLTTVTSAELKAVATMRSAAEAAEVDLFNPAVEAAAGAEADALQVGKIKNKVLKLTGLSMIDKIKIAQAEAKGADTADLETHLADEQKKLATNIATDKKSAGAKSTPVAGSDTAPAAPAPVAEAPATEVEAPATDAEVADEEVEEVAAPAPAPAAGGAFKESAYADFQISNGVAGNAEAEANAVFVDPFNGVNLADISEADLDSLATMRSAAETAETDSFNPAIEAAADEATADALQVGKIKNKVLKLVGLSFIDKIKIAKAEAAGKDTAALETHLAAEQTKLAKNIATDVASAGAASLPAP